MNDIKKKLRSDARVASYHEELDHFIGLGKQLRDNLLRESDELKIDHRHIGPANKLAAGYSDKFKHGGALFPRLNYSLRQMSFSGFEYNSEIRSNLFERLNAITNKYAGTLVDPFIAVDVRYDHDFSKKTNELKSLRQEIINIALASDRNEYIKDLNQNAFEKHLPELLIERDKIILHETRFLAPKFAKNNNLALVMNDADVELIVEVLAKSETSNEECTYHQP